MKKKKNDKSRPVWASAGKPKPKFREDLSLCLAYCAGRDVEARPMADAVLVPYDLRVNRAHCAMLCKRGIITPGQLASVRRGLNRVERDHERGAFTLDPTLEDVHINIERAVAAISGERAAGVMHTARSRNDQTATDIRLWMRDQLLRFVGLTAALVERLAEVAAKHRSTVMGGWTHGQPAMPTSYGHWAACHASALARDLDALEALWPVINQSPLGAAAGFGSSWPIDRRMTAAWLGFDTPQTNSLDCVSTRWECEARLGGALSILMTHLSSLGQDLYYFSTPPRRLIALDAAFTTGSSIMPQKRNPDFVEVTRARAASVQALLSAVTAAGRAALSGYNRDSQWTKYWIMDLVDEVDEAPRVFDRALATLEVDSEALAVTASEDFVSAVDLADFIAASRGVEFRKLYHLVADAVVADHEEGRFTRSTVNRLLEREMIEPPLTRAEFRGVLDPKLAIKRRRSLGGPAPAETSAQAKQLRTRARAAAKWAERKRASLGKASDKLELALRRLIAGKK